MAKYMCFEVQLGGSLLLQSGSGIGQAWRAEGPGSLLCAEVCPCSRLEAGGGILPNLDPLTP